MPDYEIAKVANELAEIAKPDNLNKSQEDILKALVEASNKDELKKQIELFDINQSKKNALRIAKLEQLQAKVENQMIDRFDKRPDQMSNKELLDYLTVISAQIDKSQKTVDAIETKELMQQVAANSGGTTNEVNINLGTTLSKDSKDNVVGAIKDILTLLQQPVVLPDDYINTDDAIAAVDEVEIINKD